MTPASLELDAEHMTTLLAILQQYVPEAEVWAFGSRTQGTARPFSDLDLVIVQDQPLDFKTRAELTYALSESNLPMKTDLVEWARTSASFRDIILRDHLPLKAKAA